MQRAPARPKMRLIWLALAITMGLQACGGGGGGGPDGDTNTTPTTSTVSGYGATRPTQTTSSSNSSASPSANLGPGMASSYAETTLQLAVEELNIALDKADNVLAAPPLTLAHLNALLSAGHGATASQLKAAFPDAEAWATQLKNDNPILRQLWSPQGQSFLLTFLHATDLSGANSATNAWQGHETGFFSSPATPDASFDSALQAVDSEWSSYSLEATAFNHLTIVDAMQVQASWSNATTFDGRFQVDGGGNRLMTMLKVSDGVRRYAETDFTTNALTSNGLTILSIVPSTVSVRDFAKSLQLNTAIQHSLAALSSNSTQAGEMVLPAGTLKLAQHADSVIVHRNVNLPYDEIQADMGGLDGNGGTYAKVVSPASVLNLIVNALTLQSANATEFIFSPLNQHGRQNGGGGDYGVIVTERAPPPYIPPCERAPDLKSFFLVILDAQQAVLSISTIIDPSGNATGSCTG
ncbi:MAG: hypothetical protein EKK47_22150 [Burkholderiales bacterium]|jgi:hypothetical protein|nr:MAG: hypothetical protein EKK47_22150 [Burkholderiales bacterium]